MKANPNEMSKFMDCRLFFDICVSLLSISIYIEFVWLNALNTGIIGSNCENILVLDSPFIEVIYGLSLLINPRHTIHT